MCLSLSDGPNASPALAIRVRNGPPLANRCLSPSPSSGQPAAARCSATHGPQVDDVTKCRELTQQGVTAKELGQWEQSEKLLERAVEASPTDTVTRRTLADVLWHRGATKEALVQMEAAVRLDSSDASMMVRDGEMLLATGATDKALRTSRRMQSASIQKLSSAWALRGRYLWQANQTDRALADLQRALQYSPDNPDVLMDVAAMYRQRGQHDRCLATLHHLFDTYPAGPGIANGPLDAGPHACRPRPPRASRRKLAYRQLDLGHRTQTCSTD